MKLIYFVLLIVSVAFYFLYKGDLSFILLAFMIILPLVMLVILLLTVPAVKTTAHFEHPSAERGTPAVLKITVRNRSPFPILRYRVDFARRPTMLFTPEKTYKFMISAAIGARTTETFSINITPENCGVVDVRVLEIRISDLLTLFSIKKKAELERKIISLPVLYPVQASIESSPVLSSESSTFSPVRPGDDPSEIFALREYREGDSHNRIHWKLSSRSEGFIVKELSQPVGCSVLIAMDFCGCSNASDADRILDTAFSVSKLLAESGTAHSAACACADYSIHSARITDTDAFYAEMNRLCSVLNTVITESTFAYTVEIADSAFITKGSFSRVIAVTAKTDRTREEALEALCGEARLTIICTELSPDLSEDDGEGRMAEIIYADAEKLSNSEILTI